ncbi:hypothetical protein [Pedobacter steynii]|uniref:Uncharacterized protein n=1 Tax=Pedobacter steynii TaxID=430522 RepID=A0A1D7QN34_9SPHI|nr:hypothetical protein [Pedobacter steynii]AOM80076.1 hypothetical protein BFS30_24685 [Pedobacter steynii]
MEQEMQMYNKMQDSLMVELGTWNRQENKFREIFGDQALKDRDFKKMKLSEYERLSSLYAGAATTIDEKAMVRMLQFQRRKLTKDLYPGLIRRAIHKLIVFFRSEISAKRELAMVKQAGMQPYRDIQLPGKDPEIKKSQNESIEVNQGQRHRYASRDLGKKRPRPQHKKGRSI